MKQRASCALFAAQRRLRGYLDCGFRAAIAVDEPLQGQRLVISTGGSNEGAAEFHREFARFPGPASHEIRPTQLSLHQRKRGLLAIFRSPPWVEYLRGLTVFTPKKGLVVDRSTQRIAPLH